MIVLVDSWSWIEYFNGTVPGEKVREVIENLNEKVMISTVNIAEVYKAFLRDFPHPDNERYAEISRSAMIERSYVIEVNEEIAVESAKINHRMKLGLGNSIMYATAKKEGAMVLTGDPHFKNVKDAIYLGE